MTEQDLTVLTVMAFCELNAMFNKGSVNTEAVLNYLHSYLCGQNDAETFHTLKEWNAKGYKVIKGKKSFLFWDHIDLDDMGSYTHKTISERIAAGKTKRVFFSNDVVKVA